MKLPGHMGNRRDRGVALITAMLISAIATMVAANLAWDNALDVRRTIVNLGRDQAVQVALGAESWVISILQQDGTDNDTDHLGGEFPPVLERYRDFLRAIYHVVVGDHVSPASVDDDARAHALALAEPA